MTTIDTEARVALAASLKPKQPSIETLAATERSRREKLSAAAKDRPKNARGQFLPAVIAQTVADDADSIEPTPWYVWLLLGIVIGLALCFAWAVAGPVAEGPAPGSLVQ